MMSTCITVSVLHNSELILRKSIILLEFSFMLTKTNNKKILIRIKPAPSPKLQSIQYLCWGKLNRIKYLTLLQ